MGVGSRAKEEVEDEWAERAMEQSCSLLVQVMQMSQSNRTSEVRERWKCDLTRNGSRKFGW